MAEESAKLRIPYIAAAQAQKHVTHNEAMTLLDTLVQLAVLDQDLTAPPGSPAEGDCYIVAGSGGTATGAWVGWEKRVARFIDGEWRSYLPGAGSGAGWLAYVIDEAALYAFNGTNWVIAGLQLGSYIDLGEISPPSSPGSDIARIYAKDVSGATKLAFKDHAGTETVLGAGGGGGAITQPQGRLTLTSATPVPSADVTAATTIYYTPGPNGRSVPLYDGSAWSNVEIAELSLALDSNSGHTGYHQSGKNFDLFVFDDSGTKRLGSGPAWSSDTSRGTGAGTTELARLNGLLVNANSMTLRFGASSGDTVSVAANKATYVGSFRASANGQTQVKFGGSAAGGSEAWIGIWNAYNRVPIASFVRDTTDSWTYATATYRPSNNSATMRASFVRGLDEDWISAVFSNMVSSAASSNPHPGIALDATNTNHGTTFEAPASFTGGVFSFYAGLPGLGFHYLQATEIVTGGGSTTWFGDNGNQAWYGNGLVVQGLRY